MSLMRIIDTINATFAMSILLYAGYVAFNLKNTNVFIRLLLYMAILLLSSALICYFYSNLLLVINDTIQT